MCISESWLSAHISDSAGFSLLRNDRTSTLGGVVCVFLKHYSVHPIRAVRVAGRGIKIIAFFETS